MGMQECVNQICNKASEAELSARSAKSSENLAQTYKNNAKLSENNALTYANQAQTAADVATGVVIPTEAAYSIEAIDEMIATLGNLILRNRQDNERLVLNIE